MRSLKTECCFELSGPAGIMEITAIVSFTYHPRQKGRGPTYSSSGEPDEPAYVNDIEIEKASSKDWPCNGEDIHLSDQMKLFLKELIDESDLIEFAEMKSNLE